MFYSQYQYGFTMPSPFSPENPDGSQGDSSDETEDTRSDEIKDYGSVTVGENGHFIHCLTVIGQIEGHYVLSSGTKSTKYEHVIPQIVAVEESKDIDGLIVILNTVGRACARRTYCGDDKARSFACARGRAFHRRASRSCRRQVIYSAERNDDNSPRKNERIGSRRSADAQLFSEYAGTHSAFCV